MPAISNPKIKDHQREIFQAVNLVRTYPEWIAEYTAYKNSLILTDSGKSYLSELPSKLKSLDSLGPLELDEKLCEAADHLL